jgi:ferric-dicitrate binding protein FerR (iron transport regulator)
MSLDHAPAAQAIPRSPATPTLDALEELIRRDRRRKLLLAVPVAGVIGTAVALQSTWALAVVATGLLGAQSLRR